MTATAYTVSHVSARSPELPDKQFADLLEDIRAFGQLVPLVVRGAEVIDGRKRLRVCAVLGIEPKVIDMAPNQTAEQAAHSLNVLRTHYSISQRGMFAAKEPRRGPGQQTSRPSARKNADDKATVAKNFGISTFTVEAGRTVRDHGIPELVAAVEQGKIKVAAAVRIAKAPKAAQPALLRKALTPKQKKPRPKTGRPAVYASRRTPDARRFHLATNQLEPLVDILLSARAAAVTDPRCREWARRLRQVRRIIERIIHALEKGGEQ